MKWNTHATGRNFLCKMIVYHSINIQANNNQDEFFLYKKKSLLSTIGVVSSGIKYKLVKHISNIKHNSYLITMCIKSTLTTT